MTTKKICRLCGKNPVFGRTDYCNECLINLKEADRDWNNQSLVVISNNGGKMPVLSEYHFETDTHFTYDKDNKPDYWILSDWFEARYSIYSPGDLFIILGYFGFIVAGCFYINEKFKEVNNYGRTRNYKNK